MKLKENWYKLLCEEFNQPYFKNLQKFLGKERSESIIYPASNDVFNALNLCPFENVKVVIIGQDPYHEPNQAMGMAFSVPKNVKIPPSLVNIFKEIESDLGIKCIQNGDLTRWAKQGVLLLNTVLTVKKGLANSHKNIGWEKLTRKIVQLFNTRKKSVIFVLWGNNAKSLLPHINQDFHYILTAPHPSPLSAYNGFFGCKHFSKINKYLQELGEQEINWQ